MTFRAPHFTRIGPRAPNVELLTWTHGVQPGLNPTPFIQRQWDWPNPARKLSGDLTWTSGLSPGFLELQLAPFIVELGMPPVGRRRSDLLTWTGGTPPQSAVVVQPFAQYDWPNPVRARAGLERTWIEGLPQSALSLTLPQRQTEWPNPAPKPPNLEFRTWIEGPPQDALSATIPNRQADWPNPAPKKRDHELLTWVDGLPQLALSLTVPPVQLDWPNPVLARPNFDLRIWADAPQPQTQVATPDVIGETQAQATTDITGAGLVLGTVTTQYSDSVAAGLVISQSPTAGTLVSLGSSVSIVISLGPLVVSAETPAGSRRVRTIYRVTIDGQKFERKSLAEAIELLEQAKRTAVQLAAQVTRQATEIQRGTAVPVKPPKLELPKITVSSRELRGAVTETKREIAAIYERAVRDAEIAILIELDEREKHNETLIWFF